MCVYLCMLVCVHALPAPICHTNSHRAQWMIRNSSLMEKSTLLATYFAFWGALCCVVVFLICAGQVRASRWSHITLKYVEKSKQNLFQWPTASDAVLTGAWSLCLFSPVVTKRSHKEKQMVMSSSSDCNGRVETADRKWAILCCSVIGYNCCHNQQTNYAKLFSFF